jgi:hypothetical protein
MTGTLPYDQTLTSPQTDLSGPVAHALVVMSFVGVRRSLRDLGRTQRGCQPPFVVRRRRSERGVSACVGEGAPWDAVYVVPHCPGS